MRNRKKGFTLIELVIAIAVLMILVAVTVPVLLAQIGKSKEAVCVTNRRSLKTAVLAGYLTGEYASFQEAFDSLSQKEAYSCPGGGAYSWVPGGNSGHVDCSVHRDAGGGGGELDLYTILSDSSGGRHILRPSEAWEDIQEKILNGWNIPDGYVIADGSGSFLCYTWSNPYVREAENMSAEEFVAKYPEYFTRLSSSGTVLTGEDRTDRYGQTVWNTPPQKGDICYFNGKYYVAPNEIGIWTMPPGGWIEIRQ